MEYIVAFQVATRAGHVTVHSHRIQKTNTWLYLETIHYNKELHCDQSASPIAATSPRYRDQPKEMWSQTNWLASSNLQVIYSQVIYSHPWICHHKHKSKIHSWGRKNSFFWSQRGHVNFYLLIFQSPCWDLQHSCTNSDLYNCTSLAKLTSGTKLSRQDHE